MAAEGATARMRPDGGLCGWGGGSGRVAPSAPDGEEQGVAGVVERVGGLGVADGVGDDVELVVRATGSLLVGFTPSLQAHLSLDKTCPPAFPKPGSRRDRLGRPRNTVRIARRQRSGVRQGRDSGQGRSRLYRALPGLYSALSGGLDTGTECRFLRLDGSRDERLNPAGIVHRGSVRPVGRGEPRCLHHQAACALSDPRSREHRTPFPATALGTCLPE